ncbi:MAG TPA: CopD family protein [Cyclobacteriaceae bacterium]
MQLYIKALHIIFIVTWFSGLFYVVRLFIYNQEAQEKPEEEKNVLQKQFGIMIKRLWIGITWPSCILSLIFGIWLLFFYDTIPIWLWIKLGFVTGLLLYHISLHFLYMQQSKKIFRYSSLQLRVWNELATIFLVAIIMLAVVRTGLGIILGISGLLALSVLLLSGIKIYKYYRSE